MEKIQDLIPTIDLILKILIGAINIGFFTYVLRSKTMKRIVIFQWIIIFILICIFIDIALVFNHYTLNYYDYIFTATFNLILFGLLLKMKWRKGDFLNLKINRMIILVLLLFSIAKIYFIFISFPRWDGAQYAYVFMNGVRKFDFTIPSFLIYFSYNDRVSYFINAYFSIGQFFDFGNIYLMNFQSYLLTMLSVYSFYKILCFYSNDQKIILLTTLLFVFTPLFFGVSLEINCDTYVQTFMLLTYYLYLYNKKILFFFSSLIFVTTKEIGVLLYGGFVFAIILNKLLNDKIEWRELNKIIQTLKKQISLLIPLIVYIVLRIPLVIFQKLAGHLPVSLMSQWNNNGLWCWGVNLSIIKTRLLQMFIVNFQWIYLIYWILFIIIYVKRIKKSKWNLVKKPLTIFFYPFLLFLLFNIFYIVSPVPRYISIITFFNIFFFFIILQKAKLSDRIKIVSLIVLIVLNIFSNFYTFDPVTKFFFKSQKIEIGVHNMVSMGPGYEFTNISPIDNTAERVYGIGITSDCVYNAQFVNIDILLNKFNRQIQINKNDTLLFPYTEWEIGYNGIMKKVKIFVNNNTKKRTFKSQNSFNPTVFYTYYNYRRDTLNITNESMPERDKFGLLTEALDITKCPKNCYFLTFLMNEHDINTLKFVEKYYDISNRRSIDDGGYKLFFYQINRKREFLNNNN